MQSEIVSEGLMRPEYAWCVKKARQNCIVNAISA